MGPELLTSSNVLDFSVMMMCVFDPILLPDL